MYNRLDRKKNPPDIKYSEFKSGTVSPFDMFDDGIKDSFKITDDEYDILAEKLSDELTGLFIAESLTYSEAKKLLLAIKSLL